MKATNNTKRYDEMWELYVGVHFLHAWHISPSLFCTPDTPSPLPARPPCLRPWYIPHFCPPRHISPHLRVYWLQRTAKYLYLSTIWSRLLCPNPPLLSLVPHLKRSTSSLCFLRGRSSSSPHHFLLTCYGLHSLDLVCFALWWKLKNGLPYPGIKQKCSAASYCQLQLPFFFT